MSDEELRIAVAKIDGKEPQTKCRECYGTGYEGTEQDHYPCDRCKVTGIVAPYYVSPNYPHDLNAVHEVEKKLTDGDQITDYINQLYFITHSPGKDRDFGVLFATASQRCIALVKVLGTKEEQQ